MYPILMNILIYIFIHTHTHTHTHTHIQVKMALFRTFLDGSGGRILINSMDVPFNSTMFYN